MTKSCKYNIVSWKYNENIHESNVCENNDDKYINSNIQLLVFLIDIIIVVDILVNGNSYDCDGMKQC